MLTGVLDANYLAIVERRDAQLLLCDPLDTNRQVLATTALGVVQPQATPSPERAGPIPVTLDHGDIVRVFRESDGPWRGEVLAHGGSPKAELYGIFLRSGCSPVFPEQVRREVEAWQRSPGIDDPGLVDLTHLPFVTIDGATSKDLDQAAYVERDAAGFVVYYALADASYYVPPGSALWEEAAKRAASYYLPGVMVPMLPSELSEGLVSLNPRVERRCLVIRSRLGTDGALRWDHPEGASDAFRARIRSRAKLSFGQVQAFYEGGDGIDDVPAAERSALHESLQALRAVGLARQALAEEREIVRYRRVELDVQVRGGEHRRFVAAEAIRHSVEGYNEQLSLLCNSEGARLLKEAATDPLVEPIYRVHPPPERARLQQLRELTRAVAEAHLLGDDWIWQEGQHLADYLEHLPAQPAGVAQAIHRQAVMVNVASNYQALPERHYGVGAEVYARFSAPMRELVGVFLHRELLQAIDNSATDDQLLRQIVIERANEAKRLQKRLTNEANLLVLDQIFGDQLQLPHDRRDLPGVIVGMTRSKVYVVFEEYPIDAKVHLRDLRNLLGGRVAVTEDGCRLLRDGEPLCRVGDRVRVVVEAHDVERRHWSLSLSCDA